jgi:hypothetical protein
MHGLVPIFGSERDVTGARSSNAARSLEMVNKALKQDSFATRTPMRESADFPA